MNKADFIRYSRLQNIFRPFFSGIGYILVFHRVCNEDNSLFNKDLSVSPEYLESVIKYFISKKIDIITLDECYNRITSRSKTNRFVVFTFDDGYKDNLEQALPVFEKYQVPFALFLTTGFPDNKAVFYINLLEELILKNDGISFESSGKPHFYRAMTNVEKKDAFREIKMFLKISDGKTRDSRLRSVFGNAYEGLFSNTAELMLSWDQILNLSKHNLVTIGSHTRGHFPLSRLTEDEVADEINGSSRELEERTGKPVKYLAYPYGGQAEAGEREIRIAEKCGMKMAFTACNGNIFRRHANNLFSLPRIGLNKNWSVSHIDLYINGLTPLIYRHIK